MFQENRQPTVEFVAAPKVSSEKRNYVLVAFFKPTYIPTNKIQVIEGRDSLTLRCLLLARSPLGCVASAEG